MFVNKSTVQIPAKRKEIKTRFEKRSLHIPQYNVVLLDDNDHTYDYVIDMLMQIFGHSLSTAFEMACIVDRTGRVIVYTTNKEEAEHKRDRIHAYGPDWRIPRCQGSMAAIIEPVGKG